MKSEEALHFLTQIRKTLPGVESFLQNTLVKEHLTKPARDELNSLLHILTHIQLAALPSYGKNIKHTASFSSSLSSSAVDSEHGLSTSLGTDTEHSILSFESSPFSSPTRTIGWGKTRECADSSREGGRKGVSDLPIAVSRSGRPLKVATGRLPGGYVVGTGERGKRKRRVSSTDSNTETKKLKTSRSRNNISSIKPSPPIKNSKGKQQQQLQQQQQQQQQQQLQQPIKSPNSPIQKSIRNWTENKRPHKRIAEKNEHKPLSIS